MKIIKNIFVIVLLSFFISSCAGFKLKKKSSSGEEFLIEKKDPLILPPDFSKLPEPKEDIEYVESDEETLVLDKVFNSEKSNEEKDNDDENVENSSLKKSILEKIKK